MSIKPILNRLIIRPIKKESITNSGIYIPESIVLTHTEEAEVVSVGEGRDVEPMVVKKGDKILYNKHTGTKITDNGEELVLLFQSDVYAII